MNYKRRLSAITASLFLFNFCMGISPVKVLAATKTTSLYDNSIGQGITYTKKVVTDASVKKVLNIVTCDLNNSGSNIIFSKAKDIEKKEEVLTKQVQREIFKGNNVVAGVNADMFDMGIGFSSGPQIKDGTIITNHNAKYEENIYPVFGIDKNKRAFISYIHMEADLTLENTTGSAINITTNGAVNTANGITLDSINRDNCKDKLILSNAQLNQNGRVDISSYASLKGPLTMAVIKGISAPIRLGEEYEGTIVSIGDKNKTAEVPGNGALLYGSGVKAKWINTHLKIGDKFKLRVSYDRENILEAVGAYTYFLRDGRVLSNEEMIKAGAKSELVHARKARTAIGITANNKVIAITVDGGKPSKGISDGITLLEMANLLKSMGAVNGVGMDGGGSSQMNVKLYGEKKVDIATTPSDGRERALTNGIMFVSNNPNSYVIKNITLNSGSSLNIFKNTAYKFKVSGMDTNYNPLKLDNAAFNFKADTSLGRVDPEGLFISGSKAAAGRLTVSIGKAAASTAVKVIDKVGSLKLTDNKLTALQRGVSRQFTLAAFDSTGNQVVIDNSAAAWEVSPQIGTIDNNGLLTVTAKAGSGVVTARVGDKSVSAEVAIMQDSEIIEDFEHNDNTRYAVSGTIGGFGSISKEKSKSGSFSYKIDYDYDKNWDKKSNGTINISPTFIDKAGNDLTGYYTAAIKPKKLGIWIYGDGGGMLLRAELIDGDSNKRTIDLVKKIDFTGWKYVDTDIPGDIPGPVTLNSMYFLETNKSLHNKGSIYLDDIRFIYSGNIDMKGPAFSNFKPSAKVHSSNVNISVTISDPAGVESRSIWAKLDGTSVLAKFDAAAGILSYTAKYLSKGEHSFEVKAMDTLGNSANPSFIGRFTVTDETDSQPPSISALQPSNGSVVKTNTPRISVKITDDRSGIDNGDINIYIDGNRLKVFYDEATGWTSAVSGSALADGVHKLAVNVKDRAGNKRVLQPITFTVQQVAQPRDPNNFSVSVLSDSHGSEFGPEFFKEASRNDSELVIQNGDLVDSDTASQWTEGLKQLGLVKNKPVMNSPGDREASGGSLNSYIKYLGIPTYSFEFGNSLFICLNSSVNHSINASDPTQFDYLGYVLSQNRKQNVFIYTHVPTRDNTGNNTGLPAADAARLENILGSYKKLNPEKNLNVIFGHLHSFQNWESLGVNYIIDGNESLKKYVAPEEGGYLGYTRLTVSGDKVYKDFEPMPQSIAVVDNSLAYGEMKVIKGTTKKLMLYGDFNLYSSDYIAPVNNIANVDIKWTSSAPDIVSVGEDGTFSANSEGTADIEAAVGDMKYTLRINSIKQQNEYICGFKVSAELMSITPGQGVKLTGMGYDIYGNSILLDNGQISWRASRGAIVNGIYTAPQGAVVGDRVEVSAQYKGYASKIYFKIEKAEVLKKFVRVTSASLNIRDNPSTSGSIIGLLKMGDRIEVLEDKDGWIKIDFNGKTGYISKAYTKAD